VGGGRQRPLYSVGGGRQRAVVTLVSLR
jgi:hypothetical protein